MRSARVRRALLLLAGLALIGLVLALAGEAALRAWPQLMPETARLRLHWRALADAGMGTVPHPDIGFTWPADLHGEVRRGDFGFTFTTDEKGFRNGAPWPEHADVVVLGDSHTFAYGVDDDQAWTRLVAEGLPGERLVNLGLIAASARQYLRIYETFGRALEPDLVLLMLFPGFAIEAAGEFESWLEAGRPGDFETWRFRDADLSPVVKLVKRVVESSYLLLLLSDLADGLGSPFRARSIDFADGRRIGLTPSVYAGNAARATPDNPEFARVMRALEELRDLVVADGARFLVLLMPSKEEVYLPELGAPVPSATAAFKDALRERDMRFLDLTPAFAAQADRGEPLFFEVDIHPNPAGNRLIAETVLDELRRHAARYRLAQPDPGA